MGRFITLSSRRWMAICLMICFSLGQAAALDIDQVNHSLDKLLAAAILGDKETQYAYLNPADEVVMTLGDEVHRFSREEFSHELLYEQDMHEFTDRKIAKDGDYVTVSGLWIQGDPRVNRTFYPLVLDAKLFFKQHEDRYAVHRLEVYDVIDNEMDSPIYPSPILSFDGAYYTLNYPVTWDFSYEVCDGTCAYTLYEDQASLTLTFGGLDRTRIRASLYTYPREEDTVEDELDYLKGILSWSLRDMEVIEFFQIEEQEDETYMIIAEGKDFLGHESTQAEFYIFKDDFLVKGSMTLREEIMDLELEAMRQIVRNITLK